MAAVTTANLGWGQEVGDALLRTPVQLLQSHTLLFGRYCLVLLPLDFGHLSKSLPHRLAYPLLQTPALLWALPNHQWWLGGGGTGT